MSDVNPFTGKPNNRPAEDLDQLITHGEFAGQTLREARKILAERGK